MRAVFRGTSAGNGAGTGTVTTKTIRCADCGAQVQSKAWNRTVCDSCGKAREVLRRKDWWKRNPTYAQERYYGDVERHRAEAREAARRRDPAEVRAYQLKQYHAKHAIMLQRAREYRANNRAKVVRYQRAWRERNRDAVANYERAYRESHREQRRVDFQRWRSALHGAEGVFTALEFTALCEAAGWCCTYCGERTERLTADHMMPLSRGGSNAIDNLAPACKSCNSSKGAKTPSEFAAWLAEVRP